MRNAACVLGIALLTLLAARRASGQQDVPGLDIGVKAPEFKLPDQSGNEVALADLIKKGPVALVFYRSADW